MNKETLRMQMLSGIITEGQYKAKLHENEVAAVGEKVEAAVEDKLEATVDKLSDEQKDQLRAELAKAGITANSRIEDVAGKLDESLTEVEGDTKAKVASALSDIGGGLMKSLLVPIIPVAIGSMGPGVAVGFAITAGVAGGLIALAKLLGAEKTQESLNESMIGGIVGVGAINQIPPRAKADYEMAFEHFLGQKYELKEEINEDEKPSKEELEKAIQQLMAIGWDRRDAENLVYGGMKEGKEVEEGKVNENMLAVGDNVRITAPLDADAETDEGIIAKVYPNFDSIPSEDIGYYEVDADAYDESALNSPWYKVDQDGEEMLYAAEELELN